MAKLIILDGPRGGDEVELTTGITLGRSPDNAVALPDDGISKHHFRVELKGDRFLLVDLASLNGTYVNRRRVKEQLLRHRDEVRVGSTRLLFVDPRQARQEAIGLSIPLREERPQGASRAAEGHTTAVFKLPELSEPDEFGRFMQEFEKLHMAFRMGGELAGIHEEGALGRRVLEKLFEILPADRGALFVLHGGSSELSQVASLVASRAGSGPGAPPGSGEAGHGRGGEPGRIELARAVVRSAAARRVGVLVQDLALDSRFGSVESCGGAKSAMAVPLLRRGAVMGVLYLDNVHRPQCFSAEDMELVMGVGVQVAAALESLRLYRDVEGERQARERVSRYLPPSLVERVVKGGSAINLGGEKAEITVLFADLRGFTRLAEEMPPDQVVVMLNEFFELAVEMIFRFGGTLDKFIGDAVMAFWGVPVRRSIDPHLAVLTALKLQVELFALNERRRRLNKPELGLGVGIHTGTAVAGNLGTQRRMEYTVIGDTVNLASRIQDFAPPGQVLVSGATRERMGSLLLHSSLPETEIPGRRAREPLFRVEGMYLQEEVARELRKQRRVQTSIPVFLHGEEPEGGILVDLSPDGAGILVEQGVRERFSPGLAVVLRVREERGGAPELIRGRVVSQREAFERAGTVYLHAGLKLEDGGLPPRLAALVGTGPPG